MRILIEKWLVFKVSHLHLKILKVPSLKIRGYYQKNCFRSARPLRN